MDMTLAQMGDALLRIGVFVVLVEAVTQGITLPISKRWEKSPAWIDQSVAFAIAIFACIIFAVDVFEAVGFKTAYPVLARAFTGLVVGRGSTYWHDMTLRAAPK